MTVTTWARGWRLPLGASGIQCRTCQTVGGWATCHWLHPHLRSVTQGVNHLPVHCSVPLMVAKDTPVMLEDALALETGPGVGKLSSVFQKFLQIVTTVCTRCVWPSTLSASAGFWMSSPPALFICFRKQIYHVTPQSGVFDHG